VADLFEFPQGFQNRKETRRELGRNGRAITYFQFCGFTRWKDDDQCRAALVGQVRGSTRRMHAHAP